MKDFSDFMKKMNSSDWTEVINSIQDTVKDDPEDKAALHEALLMTVTILHEYHDWLNAD